MLYRDLDAETLDREYNARASVPSFEAEYARYLTASQAAASRVTTPDLVFDEVSGQRLDLYLARPGAPVLLWIHGGYWRALSKDDNAFVAPGLLAHGISAAVMDYALCPAVTLDEIVRQVRTAVAFLHRSSAFLGLGPIAVGGSSAGGQLAGMLLLDDWQAPLGLPHDVVRTALTLSGLFELEPLRHTHQHEWLRLDEPAARRNSPLLHLPRSSATHLLAAVGGLETSEFRRQTADFVAAWTGAGHRADTIAMPAHNHFDLALSLGDPEGPLAAAVAKAMRAEGS